MKGEKFMKEIELSVEGMMCEGCEKRVENALKNVKGVSSVMASHEKRKVIVKYESNISEDVIKEKIEDLGYEVK